MVRWTTWWLKLVIKPYWQTFFGKLTTNAYSKSSSCSGFNTILQRFHDIIVSKPVGGIFLIICRSRFINNLLWWMFQDRKISKNFNISRSIYFKKISAHRFEDLVCANKLERFFFFFNFQGPGAFFTTPKPLIGRHIFAEKINLYFFECDYLILT